MGLSNPPYDDYYLLRFLRARKFNIKKTELMFKEFIEWRKKNDVDNIMTVIKNLIIDYFLKINCPIIIKNYFFLIDTLDIYI